MVDVIDELIRVGLMVGAVFQLVCIAAVIWIPTKDDTKGVMSDSSEDDVSNVSLEINFNTISQHFVIITCF